MAGDLLTGPSPLSVQEALEALASGPWGDDRTAAAIVWSIRLPMTIMGALVGIGLGIAGLQMQTILNNPLASPFTLGFSAAAGFWATIAIMFGAVVPVASWIAAPVAAFAMTLLACSLVYVVARFRGAQAEILILAGIAVMFMFQACQSLLQYLAEPEVLQQMVFWLFGSLMRSNWISVAIVVSIVIVCTPLLAKDAWLLTAMKLGDAHAGSLGADVDDRRPGPSELSFMPQTLALSAQLSVLEVVLLGRLLYLGWSLRPSDIDAAEEALNAVGMADLAHRRVDTLSGGQQQLLLLAQRLIRKPQILLLDEPTSALGLSRQLLVLTILKAYAQDNDALVAVDMHDLSLAARFSHARLVLNGGHCACFGRPEMY